MLSPRAIRLVLRLFDSIDQAVTTRLVRKRPWTEEALTGLLCDLLDAETQEDERLEYSLVTMHKDFVRFDEPISIRLKVETHQYPKHLERWVTQSDLGLVVNYQNQFAPEFSLRRSWLLQAKRVFPSSGGNSYDRYSAFPSRDSEQEKRMRYLRDWAGEDFIRFLLYCPRPKTLGQPVRETLNQLRTNALSRNIFDYAFGLQLRDDLLSENPTVAAGMFVAPLDHCPSNLGDVHQSLFNQTIPFSWFMIEHYSGPQFPDSSLRW